MLVQINVEDIILGYVSEWLYAVEQMFKARVKNGYPKGRTYWYGTIPEVDKAIDREHKAQRMLSSICYTLKLDHAALVYMGKLLHKRTPEFFFADCEKLYIVLTEPAPLKGIYLNEYYEKAIKRLEA